MSKVNDAEIEEKRKMKKKKLLSLIVLILCWPPTWCSGCSEGCIIRGSWDRFPARWSKFHGIKWFWGSLFTTDWGEMVVQLKAQDYLPGDIWSAKKTNLLPLPHLPHHFSVFSSFSFFTCVTSCLIHVSSPTALHIRLFRTPQCSYGPIAQLHLLSKKGGDVLVLIECANSRLPS